MYIFDYLDAKFALPYCRNVHFFQRIIKKCFDLNVINTWIAAEVDCSGGFHYSFILT